MTDIAFEEKQLIEECRIFCRYLIKRAPTSYIQSKYLEGHEASGFVRKGDTAAFDIFLVKIAKIHPLLARLADSYCRIFRKTTLLRRKLILLLAILESAVPFYSHFDLVDAGGQFKFYIKLAATGMIFGGLLLLSAIVLIPLGIFFGVFGRSYSKLD